MGYVHMNAVPKARGIGSLLELVLQTVSMWMLGTELRYCRSLYHQTTFPPLPLPFLKQTNKQTKLIVWFHGVMVCICLAQGMALFGVVVLFE